MGGALGLKINVTELRKGHIGRFMPRSLLPLLPSNVLSTWQYNVFNIEIVSSRTYKQT